MNISTLKKKLEIKEKRFKIVSPLVVFMPIISILNIFIPKEFLIISFVITLYILTTVAYFLILSISMNKLRKKINSIIEIKYKKFISEIQEYFEAFCITETLISTNLNFTLELENPISNYYVFKINIGKHGLDDMNSIFYNNLSDIDIYFGKYNVNCHLIQSDDYVELQVSDTYKDYIKKENFDYIFDHVEEIEYGYKFRMGIENIESKSFINFIEFLYKIKSEELNKLA